MKKDTPVITKPRRLYLMDQVLEVMQKHIDAGDWGDFLPPERVLAERMQVGRNTIRQAVSKLESERLIDKGHAGRRRRILATPRKQNQKSSQRIILLTPDDPARLSSFNLREADILRRIFSESDTRLDVITSKAYILEKCAGVLKRLTSFENADLWILKSAPLPIQKWFSENPDIPAMVIGYTYPDIEIPYVTENIGAAANHAIGLLSANGHSSVGVLQQRSILAGHNIVYEAIEKSCLRHSIELKRISFDQAPEGLCRRLDVVMSEESRPSAIITTKITDLITALGHFAQSDLRIPADVSVVSLFDDPSFDHVVPKLTRYGVNMEHMMHQVATMADKIINKRKEKYEPVQLIPNLIAGETVARL